MRIWSEWTGGSWSFPIASGCTRAPLCGSARPRKRIVCSRIEARSGELLSAQLGRPVYARLRPEDCPRKPELLVVDDGLEARTLERTCHRRPKDAPCAAGLPVFDPAAGPYECQRRAFAGTV